MKAELWRINLCKWSLVHAVKLTITFRLRKHGSRLIIVLQLLLECIHVDVCLNGWIISLFSRQNNRLLFWLNIFDWLLPNWRFLLFILFNLRFNWDPLDFIFAYCWGYYFLNKWSSLRRWSLLILKPWDLAGCFIIRKICRSEIFHFIWFLDLKVWILFVVFPLANSSVDRFYICFLGMNLDLLSLKVLITSLLSFLLFFLQWLLPDEFLFV